MSFYDYTFGLCIPPQVIPDPDPSLNLGREEHILRVPYLIWLQQNFWNMFKSCLRMYR